MRSVTTQSDLLAGVKEIKWTNESYVKSSHGNWKVPKKEIRLGQDWYYEKYELLYQAPEKSIVIDVGCKTGDWIGVAKNVLPTNIITIGVDPIDYNVVTNMVTHYYCCAIDNIDGTQELTFNIFDEPGCNSLLPKSNHLTMRNVLNVITVPVKSLENILSNYSDSDIHFLKCDCQGKDVEVVKSLRKFLTRTKYVQIECSFDKNQPFYDGQPSYEEDILELAKIGFEPIYFVDYLGSPLPEGEIILKNKYL